MKKLIKYGVPVILGLILCLNVYAQFDINEINKTKTGLPESNVSEIVVNIVQWFLALVGIVALVILVWAGVSYMTAGGDEEKVEKAKTRLTYGIIGVVVAIAGLVIVHFINEMLAGNVEGGDVDLSP